MAQNGGNSPAEADACSHNTMVGNDNVTQEQGDTDLAHTPQYEWEGCRLVDTQSEPENQTGNSAVSQPPNTIPSVYDTDRQENYQHDRLLPYRDNSDADTNKGEDNVIMQNTPT